MLMTIKPTTSATAEPEQSAITTSQYPQETVENRRTERRGANTGRGGNSLVRRQGERGA